MATSRGVFKALNYHTYTLNAHDLQAGAVNVTALRATGSCSFEQSGYVSSVQPWHNARDFALAVVCAFFPCYQLIILPRMGQTYIIGIAYARTLVDTPGRLRLRSHYCLVEAGRNGRHLRAHASV